MLSSEYSYDRAHIDVDSYSNDRALTTIEGNSERKQYAMVAFSLNEVNGKWNNSSTTEE